MIAARIAIYLRPAGVRLVDGWVEESALDSVGVAKLQCASGAWRFFGFAQPHGARLTHGHETRKAAHTEAVEIAQAVERVRGVVRESQSAPRYAAGPRWRIEAAKAMRE